MDDHQLAARLAGSTGGVLTALQSAGLLAGSELGDAGDRVAQAWIGRVLARLRPSDQVRSEEAARSAAATEDAGRLWIVDPLDGTREFAEARTDWAVHIALLERGELTAAAVALPGLGELFSTAAPAQLPPIAGPLRIAISRSRPPAFLPELVERLAAQTVPLGSAGFKAMAVLRGEVHAYLHAGGQYEWDNAAPVGVARQVGLHASRIDGSALEFGKVDPWSPDLLICRPELADQLLGALAGVSRARPAD
jgi:3'(2'), 5'-bisphosphate nucleotidase